jgi:hypothetical protein
MTCFSKKDLIKTIVLMLLLCLGLSESVLAQDKHIDVSVNGNKLVFLNSECPDRAHEKGCVTAEYGSSPVISWELTGPGSEQWSFSGLRFGPTPLQECTVTDFELTGSDRESGHASTAQIVSNGRRLQIRDRNTSECITQYTLSAVSSDGRQIDSDPIIDNRGGGR